VLVLVLVLVPVPVPVPVLVLVPVPVPVPVLVPVPVPVPGFQASWEYWIVTMQALCRQQPPLVPLPRPMDWLSHPPERGTRRSRRAKCLPRRRNRQAVRAPRRSQALKEATGVSQNLAYASPRMHSIVS
jgi:hypothetical protein